MADSDSSITNDGITMTKPTAQSGIDQIAAERLRQVTDEGYDPAHDDAHTEGELAEAATAYVQGDGSWWPWENQWKPWGGRVGNLVKAGALIAAEIDRLQRAEASRGE